MSQQSFTRPHPQAEACPTCGRPNIPPPERKQWEAKPGELSEFTLPLGKHKGRKLVEVFREAPDYVKWLAESLSDGTVKRRANEVLALQAKP